MKENQHMGHGGARIGAGRKAGSGLSPEARGKRLQAKIREKLAFSDGKTPLDFMLGVMQDERHKINLRMQAAVAAAPYVHAKLSSVEVKGNSDQPLQVQSDIGQALAALAELARQQTGQTIDLLPSEVKVIDAAQQDIES